MKVIKIIIKKVFCNAQTVVYAIIALLQSEARNVTFIAGSNMIYSQMALTVFQKKKLQLANYFIYTILRMCNISTVFLCENGKNSTLTW